MFKKFRGGGKSTVWRRMCQLVAVTVLPMTLVGAFILNGQYDQERARAEGKLVEQAQSIASIVDRELGRTLAIAQMLAGSAALQSGDLESFRLEAEVAQTAISTSVGEDGEAPVVAVFARDEAGLLTSSLSEKQAPGVPASGVVQRAIDDGQVQISNAFVGSNSGEVRIAVVAPVRGGSILKSTAASASGAVVIGLSPEHLRSVALSDSRLLGIDIVLRDRTGIAIARSASIDHVGELPLTPGLLTAILARDSGLFAGPSARPDGSSGLVAFARAPRSGYIVVLGLSQRSLMAPLKSLLVEQALVGAAVLLLGVAVALVFARNTSRALRRVLPIADRAVLLGRVTETTGLLEADALADEIARHLAGRLRAEIEQAASAERLRALTEAIPQMVWAATPSGELTYCNPRLTEGTGLTLPEAKGGAFWLAMHPSDQVASRAEWDRSVLTGEPFEVEYRLRMADGAYRWMLRRVVPVRDSVGTIEQWLATCTDISEIVAARELQARSHDQLELMVEERTRDLEQSQAKLARSARLQALGQLVAGIAHDFNNVLHAVQGCSELINRHAEAPARVRQYAGRIASVAERGSFVTARMLAFSRQSPLVQEVVDVASLFASLRDTLGSVLGSGIEVRTVVPTESIGLLADNGQLETILVNLATNARDAMGTVGTVEFSATVENVGQVRRDLPVSLAPGRYVRLSVRDTGAGMDAETLARAAEPFFTTKPVGSGTGLGLSMAHGFAEQSGGNMHIESVAGRGTAIHLWFLEASADETPNELDDAGVTPSGADSRRIVLVDDDPVGLMMMRDQLFDAGFDVAAFENGMQALDHLRADARVDGLISDYSMPNMDGLSLIKAAQQLRPGLPAVLCTGFVDTSEAVKLGTRGGDFRLVYKPSSASKMIAELQALMSENRSRAPTVLAVGVG